MIGVVTALSMRGKSRAVAALSLLYPTKPRNESEILIILDELAPLDESKINMGYIQKYFNQRARNRHNLTKLKPIPLAIGRMFSRGLPEGWGK